MEAFAAFLQPLENNNNKKRVEKYISISAISRYFLIGERSIKDNEGREKR